MPLHLDPVSRRSFLAHSAAALAGISVLRTGWTAEPATVVRLALLSDTHIPENPDVTAREVNMTTNLQQVVREVLAQQPQPSGVLINGDCAYLKGLPTDYQNLASCLAPIRDAGLPLHLTMGNHDNRDVLYEVIASQRPQQTLVNSKHVTVLETPVANWFLLDSLMEVNVVTGQLGEEQRGWLTKALDDRADKPAIVMAHHTPQFEAPPEGQRWGGIQDTAELFEILQARAHVKAYIYGHSHNWSVTRRERLHLINLPPVAYVFAAGKPNGWVSATVHASGLTLELRTIDPAHPQQGEKVELTWS